MNYVYILDYAAIVLVSVLLALVYIRKNVNSNRLHLFKSMLVCHLLACIFDILSTKAINNPTVHSTTYNNVTTIIFYLFHTATAVLFVFYGLVSERKEDNNKKQFKFWSIVYGVVALFIITSPLTKLIFYFDTNLVYKHGFLLYGLYLVCYVEVMYVFYLKIKNWKNLSNFEIICNFLYLLMLLYIFVYNLMGSKIIVELFMISIAFMVMYISQDNPEKYLYKGIEVFNRNAFDEKLIDLFNTKKKFNVLLFTVKESEKYRTNSNSLFSEEKYILNLIKNEKDIKNKLYVIDDLIFAVICDDEQYYIDEINTLVNDNLEDGSQLSFGIFRCPDMTDDYIRASNIIDDLALRLPLNLGDNLIEGDVEVNINIKDKEIEKYIRNAIANKEVFVGNEPIYSLENGYSTDMQTYVYILGENNSRISFFDFSRVARKNNLLDQIDDIVLEKICIFLEKIEKLSLGTNTIYIPISPYRLLNRRFSVQLRELKRKYHLPENKIAFILTNIRVISSRNDAIENMKEANELGFKFAVENDDFDMLDLSTLYRLPISTVRISARLFEAESNENLDKLVKNLLSIYNDLDIDVVLSYTDNEDIYTQAKQLGFKYAKGKYFSPIYTDDEYVAFMQKQLSEKMFDISSK